MPPEDDLATELEAKAYDKQSAENLASYATRTIVATPETDLMFRLGLLLGWKRGMRDAAEHVRKRNR